MKKEILKFLFLAVGFILLFLLEKCLLQEIFTPGAAVDLIFIAVFLFNFLHNQKIGLGAGFLGGLCLDFVSVFPFGAFSLTLGIMALLIQKLEIFFHKSNLFSFAAIFFLSFLFYKLFAPVFALILNLFLNKEPYFSLPFNLIAIAKEFFYDFFVAGFVFVFFKWKTGLL